MLRCSFLVSLFVVVLFCSSSLAFSPPPLSNATDCLLCKEIAGTLIPLIRSNATLDIITPIAVAVCELIKPECGSPATCKELCQGVVGEYAREIIYIATETLLAPNEICWIVGKCDKPAPVPPPTPYVPVPSNLSDTSGEKQWPAWSLTGEGYYLHVSDFHIDPYYTPGTNSDCGLPLCCHAENGAGSSGYWGDYACDTSPQLVENFIQYVATLSPPPDFILYTGDDVPHNIWNQSQSFNLGMIHQINAWLVQYLPGIPIFSAIGNHEAYPVNQFEGPGADSWLYDHMALDFAHYLSDDALHTFRYAGYYQARIRPGLRVVSVNGNLYQEGSNFWLWANDTDVAMQLPWLEDVFQQAQALGDKVVIICHIWPTKWEQKFAQQFIDLTRKYADLIIGQHYGHAHNGFGTGILAGTTTSNPLLVAPLHHGYVGGSIVTYGSINPGYQSYSYSRDNFAKLPFLATTATHYWVDLAGANAGGKDKQPDWQGGAVDVQSTFGMKDLSAQSWSDVANRMLTDDQVYTRYIQLYFKGHVPTDQSGWPSRTDLVCYLLSGSKNDFASCQKNVQPITAVSIQ